MSQSRFKFETRTLVAFLTILVLMMAPAAFSQNAGFGGISGVVTDASGAVVSGAQVKIDNDAKAYHRTFTTTSAGAFSVET